MTHKKDTEQIYREIMNKVIDKVKDTFISEGISDDTINLLKRVKLIYLSLLEMGGKIIWIKNFST